MQTTTMIRFSDAVYHKKRIYSFGPTEFTAKELKTIIFIDGRRSVKNLADILYIEESTIKPIIAKLVQLNIIQTEDEILFEDTDDLILVREIDPMVETTYHHLSTAA